MKPSVACLLVVLCSVVAIADNPARHVRGGKEMLFDPTDERKVEDRFGSDAVKRDQGMPGTPIVEVCLPQGADRPKRDDVSLLAKLPYLRRLYGGNLGVEEVRAIGRLRQLENLNLYGVDLGADDLAPLTRLRSLTVTYSNVGDGSLAALRQLQRLESLCLGSCPDLTDRKVKEIASLHQLRSVSLSGTSVTDAGLEELAALEGLEALDLRACITITGTGLKSLAKLKKLRTLKICECSGIHAGDVSELKAALPKCTIIGP